MYVYAIADEYNNLKIGIALDVEARLRQLQTGNATKLRVMAKHQCVRPIDARNHESRLLYEWRHMRLEGEWLAYSEGVWGIVETMNKWEH